MVLRKIARSIFYVFIKKNKLCSHNRLIIIGLSRLKVKFILRSKDYEVLLTTQHRPLPSITAKLLNKLIVMIAGFEPAPPEWASRVTNPPRLHSRLSILSKVFFYSASMFAIFLKVKHQWK